ncbi:hypothetical protein EV421DRAFT_1496055 [Armillaria borealis]|uniref:Secreted protein n=1 Tax=Armillaria borealis TaxID=47425 RepID=A0AA39IY68_9AGAR|nr:hypothetical protein EV421DRAFT_1496055 [Armillaria borealis]
MFVRALKANTAQPFLFFLLSLSSFLCPRPGNRALSPSASSPGRSFPLIKQFSVCECRWKHRDLSMVSRIPFGTGIASTSLRVIYCRWIKGV